MHKKANTLMGSPINVEDIEYVVDLMKNQDDQFKQRRVEFYHNHDKLFRLQEEGAAEEER